MRGGIGRGRRWTGVVAGVAVATLAILLSGCELFLGPTFGRGFGEAFPSSSPIASYSHGTATIAIAGGETVVLGELPEPGEVDALFGSDIHWASSSGWHLHVTGAGSSMDPSGMTPDGAYVTFDRITDGQHWTSGFDNRCIVDVATVSGDAIRGTAACKGVEWFDALTMPTSHDGPKPLDEPKFDAEVTFEATR